MWSVTAELLLESSRYLTMEHRRRAPPRIADSPPLESSHKEIQTATTVKGERPDAVRTLCRASVNTTTSPAHATHLQDQGGEVGEHEFNGGGGRAIARGGGKRRSLSSPVGLCMEEDEEPPFSHIATNDVEMEELLGGGGGGCCARKVVAMKELYEEKDWI
ncbi:hypothetical protein OsJ_30680 [Oryza sativa Japonica Group]|uniref:Uncharacterized protein n=3 Tax=Oryza TaxID=4527 RepID=Q7G6T9_ORYSJ|nr:Hypothetical protein [Oryza sativa]AAM08415.1 Hypothetical protein [Oryza sativa]AAP52063.1 hypothetical protein LOC_Os10g05030 [Oryza sativa Japonica Group]EAZ15261.1 hypothetical protein OsJ_30680 [Oryza sativa Japonica Group]